MDGTDHLVRSDNTSLLPQHVKHALDHMRGNMAGRITLAGLASTCAVPERTLLKQFERFLGHSPLAWLRRLRLNAARSEPVDPESKDTIADIALRCGFAHLGRFATDYRRRFGETPSATRQRVRARAVSGAAVESRASCSGRRFRVTVWLGHGAREAVTADPAVAHRDAAESLEARDLTERLAATLSRMRVASVAWPIHRAARDERTAATQCRQPILPVGPADTA